MDVATLHRPLAKACCKPLRMLSCKYQIHEHQWRRHSEMLGPGAAKVPTVKGAKEF